MTRILQTTMLLLAAAAVLAPSALADRPDDRAGMLGVGAVTPTSGSIRPDDRAGVRGPGSISTGLVAAGAATDGFDWSDAGVGAVGAFGLALLLLGGYQLASRTRPHATA